jgi:hypothetical protein
MAEELDTSVAIYFVSLLTFYAVPCEMQSRVTSSILQGWKNLKNRELSHSEIMI